MTPQITAEDRLNARLYALSAALANVLPYALSRAEDLHELHESGDADSQNPDAHLRAGRAYEEAESVLHAVAAGALAQRLQLRDVGAQLAAALDCYVAAPFIGNQYGAYQLRAAREAVQAWRLACADADVLDDTLGDLAERLRESLNGYLDAPGIKLQYGEANYVRAADAVDAYWTCRLAELGGKMPPLRPGPDMEPSDELDDDMRPGM